MKQYAHRVLYLRDGKVHNVEIIPEVVRSQALMELATKLKETEESAALAVKVEVAPKGVLHPLSTGSSLQEGNIVFERPLGQELENFHVSPQEPILQRPPQRSTTTTRHPQHYATHSAMRPINFQLDVNMQQAVQLLFKKKQEAADVNLHAEVELTSLHRCS